jgi:hypothetical protein
LADVERLQILLEQHLARVDRGTEPAVLPLMPTLGQCAVVDDGIVGTAPVTC